jgi:hypothetical protein
MGPDTRDEDADECDRDDHHHGEHAEVGEEHGGKGYGRIIPDARGGRNRADAGTNAGQGLPRVAHSATFTHAAAGFLAIG